ncbi:PucR family transcriptional regulator [Peptostreptococcus equinus]|uniref:PucR family transcriptional regulator ligand-binding domain-containing protein n=1 Tax=Peptostreptococcus equinus TaxID=3003601 RepID=A0ABY7JS69_9FIRM|nr:PucR family transcriptional regulator [Peptostreptococcus sp. CBA3647]WAW14542.1 PucR family transcriptional regulator ligand-binding domain-containing protein [Peptostreptococcus sp. CBA3647]
MNNYISVRDILKTPDFKNFEVLAGNSALDNEVTSITIMDSPDPFPWSKGGEIVLSSGYVFKKYEDEFDDLLVKMKDAGIVALFIKVERYFKNIPMHILELADQIGFVIVNVPIEMAFKDVINPTLSRIVDIQSEAIKISERVHDNFTQLVINGDDTSTIVDVIGQIFKENICYYDQYFDKLYYKNKVILCDNKEKLKEINILLGEKSTYKIGPNRKIYGYIIFLDIDKDIEVEDLYNTLSHANTALILDTQKKISSMQIEDRHKNEFIHDIIMNNIKSQVEVEARAKVFGWMFTNNIRAMVIDIDDFKEQYLKIYKNDQSAQVLNDELENIREHMLNDVIRIVKSYYISSVYAILSDSIIFLLQSDREEDREKSHLLACGKEVRKSTRENYDFTVTIGVGEEKTSIVDVHESYKEAQMSIKIARVIFKKNAYMLYSELGVYRVLYSIYENEDVKSFCDSKIGSIVDYDRKYDSDLLDTLINIAENDWNLKTTAEKMYMHYNTIKYRYKKICSILAEDLSHSEARLSIGLALKIYQMNL